jgi:hypothetical protein
VQLKTSGKIESLFIRTCVVISPKTHLHSSLSLSLSLSPTHTLTLSLLHTYIHFTHTHTLFLISLSLYYTHSFSLRRLSISFTHTHTHTHTNTHTHTHTTFPVQSLRNILLHIARPQCSSRFIFRSFSRVWKKSLKIDFFGGSDITSVLRFEYYISISNIITNCELWYFFYFKAFFALKSNFNFAV